MVRLIQITQGYYGDLAGKTVDEVMQTDKDRIASRDKAAEERGLRMTDGMPVVVVRDLDGRVPPCPWGHEQYVVEGEVLGPRQANWDSSG